MKLRTLFAYAIGPLGSAAIGVISLPLIAWYFPPEDIGRVVLLQTVAALVLNLLGLGLDQAYIREYHAAEHRAALFKTILWLPLSLLIGLLIIMMGYRVELAEQVVGISHAQAGSWVLAFCAALFLTRYLSLILRMQERAWAFSLSQLLPKIGGLLLVLLGGLGGWQAHNSTLIAIYALAQWGAVLLLLVQTQHDLSQALQAPLQLPVLRSSLQYGVPLMLSGLAYWGLSSADRWLLKLWGNLSELGVYSMAISLGAAALIVQNIFATVWSPTVFKWVKEERNLEQISKVFGYMLDLVVAVLCCVGLASPVIPFFLPAQYADVQFIVLSSMLFPLLYTLTEISGIGINVCKQTWINTLISVVALLIHVVLCYGLIPAWGAKGAAMALAMAFWLFYVAKTEVSMRLWLPLPRIPAYGITLAALLLCLAYTYAGNTANYGFFAVAWGMVLLGLAWKYRHLLRRWLPI